MRIWSLPERDFVSPFQDLRHNTPSFTAFAAFLSPGFAPVGFFAPSPGSSTASHTNPMFPSLTNTRGSRIAFTTGFLRSPRVSAAVNQAPLSMDSSIIFLARTYWSFSFLWASFTSST